MRRKLRERAVFDIMKAMKMTRTARLAIQFVFSLALLFCKAASAQNYFWEAPVRVSQSGACFPRAVDNGKNAAVFWQEVDSKNSSIYLSVQYCDGGKWNEPRRFAGPFPYSGEVPDLYSAAMSAGGTLAVGVLSDASAISVYASVDGARSFTENKFSKQNLPLVAPRIYAAASGDFLLFTSLGRDESFSMLLAKARPLG